MLTLLLAACPSRAESDAAPLAAALRELDADVPGGANGKPSRLVRDDITRRRREAGERDTAAWRGVKTRADWEAFAAPRIKALRDSLNLPAEPTAPPRLRVTGRIAGDGYRIENLVFESRPGLVVTANLYLPAGEAPKAKPAAFLLSHSHHAPKTQSELQDMGINWARAGSPVLVPDHLGHGERRQHPFPTAESFPGPFRAGRQDYYFRYNESLQLHLAGESLMGWMVWDLMRGVDVLIDHAGADPKRIILIGAVAGGGDPAGVAAALDPRVAAVVPFNFGGPQPDTAIPANAERDFDYFGEPYWESTRCLRVGARDGFAHWVIVASVAPRRLVYSYEFAMNLERDPVWPRIQQVYKLYDAADHLATAQGQGNLKGKPPEASHCNNVGPLHRAGLYPALQKWFGIAPPATENTTHYKAAELACLTPAAVEEFKPRPLYELAAEVGRAKAAATRSRGTALDLTERRKALRTQWAGLLGDVTPGMAGESTREAAEPLKGGGGVSVVRASFSDGSAPGTQAILLTPAHEAGARHPAVVMFAQAGKRKLLRERSREIADLLSANVIVCLVDLRGTGETAPEDAGRGRNSEGTSWSQGELMLGRTVLGGQLRELRNVLRELRNRSDVHPARIALWGDSLAPANPADRKLDVPVDADGRRDLAEPMGAMIAQLAMLFDEDVRAAYGRGGLASFDACLKGSFLYLPHDAIVPGALTAGDLPDLAAAIAPRPLRLDAQVDGLNRLVSPAPLPDVSSPVAWLVAQLSPEKR